MSQSQKVLEKHIAKKIADYLTNALLPARKYAKEFMPSSAQRRDYLYFTETGGGGEEKKTIATKEPN